METKKEVENKPLRQNVGNNLKHRIIASGQKIPSCFIYPLMVESREHLNKVGVFFYSVLERSHPDMDREQINIEWLGSLSRSNATLQDITEVMLNNELNLNEALMVSHSLYFSTLKKISEECPGLVLEKDDTFMVDCLKCKEQLQQFKNEELAGSNKMEEANQDAVQRVLK